MRRPTKSKRPVFDPARLQLEGLEPRDVPATYAEGDVLILGYGATDPDSLRVVNLKAMDAGDVIHFTDNGFTAGATGRTGEGFLSYTAPVGGHPVGTVLTWTNGMAIAGTGWSSASPGNFAFSASGDQLFVFTGLTANWASQSGITLLAGVNHVAALGGMPTSNNTVQPTALTAAFLNLPTSSANNAYYSGTGAAVTSVFVGGTPASLVSDVNTPAKWYRLVPTGIITYPTATTLVVTASPANQSVAAGANTTFTAAASGNTAPTPQWEESTNGGTVWAPLGNAGVYSGVTLNTLTITGATAGMTGYKYRAVYTNSGGSARTAEATLTVTAPVTVTVNPPTLPDPVLQSSYSQPLSATGGTAPYTFDVSVGTLPTGLSLDSNTGVLSGTPTASGTFPFTVRATDSASNTGTRAYTLVVPLVVGPTSLPDGTRGVAYSQTITATGGTAPYTFGVSAGALPGGLSLDSATGVISGTPTTANTFNFTITATNGVGRSGSRAYAVVIAPSAGVASIVRVGGPNTNAASVMWTVTFSQAVSGLGASNFTLADLTSSLTGEGIASVVAAGGGSSDTQWTVTASTGTAGDGTLRLNVTSAAGVSPTLLLPPAEITSADFVVDRTAPTVVISAPSAALTAGGPVTFTVTYSGADNVMLAPGHVSLNATVGVTATVGVSSSGNTQTVTLSAITGTGTLGISLAANTASDLAGNFAPTAGPSATFAVDNTPPAVTSIVLVGSASVTNAAQVRYTVTFSEPVSLGATPFTTTTTGPISGVSVASATGGPTAFTVTVNTGGGDGSIRLDVPAASTVRDAALNAVTPFATGPLFTIDRTAPAVTIGAPSVPITAGDSVTFEVTYADANLAPFTLAPGLITLDRGGTANAVVSVSSSGTTQTVTLSGVTGNGTLGITLPLGTAADAAGNPAAAAGPSAAVTVDNAAPTVTSVVRTTGSPNPTNATSALYTVTFNEDVQLPPLGAFTPAATGTLTGTSVTSVTVVDARTYTVAVATGGGDGTLRLNILAGAAVTDTAGNPVAGSFTTGEAYKILKSAPAVATTSVTAGSVTGPVGYSGTVDGIAADALGGTVASVSVSIQRSSDLSFWTGSAWSGSGSLAATVTGTTWSVPFPAAAQTTGVTYTITSAATDAAGNVGTGAAVAYQWDAAAPAATVALAGTVFGPGTWPGAVGGPATDNGPAGVAVVNVVVTRTSDGFSYNATTQSWGGGMFSNAVSPAAGAWSLPLPAAQLTHGDSYTVSAAAVDAVGNVQSNAASAGFGFDTVAPTSAVTDPGAAFVGPNGWPASNQLAGTVSDAGATVSLGITRSSDGFFWNGTAWQSASAVVGAAVAGGSWTYTLSAAALTDGLSYTVTSTATDGAGNVQPVPASRSFTWDSAAPTQTITTPVGGSFAGPSAFGDFSGTASDPGAAASGLAVVDLTFTRGSDGFFWNGSAFVGGPSTVPAALTGGSWSYSFDPANLTDGVTYTLAATARDIAGNVGTPAAAAFTYDAAGPTATITAPAAGSTATASGWTGLAGTTADGGAGVRLVEYRVLTAGGLVWDGGSFETNGDWFAATGTTNWTAVFPFANFPAGGGYRVEARATDAAGNVGPVAAVDFTVAVPSVTGIARQSPTVAVSNTTAPVTWLVTFSDPVSGLTAANFALAGSFAVGSAITDITPVGSVPALEWEVTATAPPGGTGMLGLDYVSNWNIAPAASAAPVVGAVYTLDRVVPTVSITNDAPAAMIRVNQAVRYTVTFADDTALASALLTAGDVTNAVGTGAAPFTVGGFTMTGPASYAFDVTLSGEGDFRLRLTAAAVTDTAGNTLAVPVTDATTLAADGTAPTVASVVPAGSSPTQAASVSYTVTLSEPVTGVDAGDFALFTTGGIAPGAITVGSGSGTTFTVTVNTGSGDGTIRLDVLANGAIRDAAGNPLVVGFTTAGAFTIDRTAPTVTVTLDAGQPTLTSTEPVRFVVAFSDPVVGFGPADVQLGGTAGGLGTASRQVTNPNGDGRTFLVAVSGLTTDGTLSVTVPVGAAADAAGNALALAASSPVVTLDRAAPFVSAVRRVGSSPTNAASVGYEVTFSEAVTGVDAGDFALVAGVSGAAITSVGGGGAVWTVVVGTGSGDGSVRLDLRSDATATDAAGNALAAGGFTGEVFDIDRTGPTGTIAAPTPTLRNTPVGSVAVTFDQAVGGLDLTDLTLTRDGVALDLSAAQLTGDGSAYTLGNLAGLTGSGGVYVLTLTASGSGVADTAGNPLTADAATTFTVDVAAPTVTITPLVTGPTNAATVAFTVAFSEPVLGVDTDPAGAFDFFAVTGTAPGTAVLAVASGAPGVYTVTVGTGGGAGTVGLAFGANTVVTDAAGNVVSGLPAASAFVAIDHVRPTVAITDADADGIVAVNTVVLFTVDVIDAGGVTGSLTAADFENAGGTTITVGTITDTAVAGGRRFNVPVTPTSGGSLLLRLRSTAVADAAGNTLILPVVAGRTLTVDATAPGVSVSRADGQAADTNTQPVRFAVVFTEPVVGFGPGGVRLTGPGTTGAGVAVSGDGQTFVVTVSGLTADGPVTLTVPAAAVTDAAGNANLASTGGDNTVTLDTAPPAVGTPVLAAASDTGAADGVTADATPTFTGSAEPGATVELYEGVTRVGTATATAAGWTITSDSLADGPRVVFARATDAAGNVADSGPVTVMIDTTGPTVAVTRTPGQADTVPGTDGGVSLIFAVTTSEPVGSLNPAAVTVTGSAGGSVTGVTGSGSTFLITVGGITRPGIVSVAVAPGAAADAAGNPTLASPAGEAVAVQYSTTVAVSVPVDLVRAGQPLPVGVLVSSAAAVPVTGTVTVTLTGPGGTVTQTAPAPGADGRTAVTFTGLSAGNYAVTAVFAGTGGFLDGTGGAGVSVFPALPTGQNSTGVHATVTATTATLLNPDGSVRGTVAPFSRDESKFGVRVAVADVTGDGVPDVVAGTATGVPAAVRVVDGVTGAVVYSLDVFEGFHGGVFVAAGDLNGDGRSEFVVTPDQGGGGRVLVFDGATGARLASFLGIRDDNFRGGARVAVGDLNADGVADLLVSAGFGGGPRVAGFDGTTIAGGEPKQLFNDFFLFAPDLRDGVFVTVGDVDGDGYGDVIGGAGPGGAPRVLALSGFDLVTTGALTPLTNFFAGPTGLRGGVRVTAKDFDGDGRTDLVTGSGDTGTVFVYTNAALSSADTRPDRELDMLPGLLPGVHVG